MHTTTYPSPVDKLLTYGTLEPGKAPEWPNYAALGIGPEHIPDLIRNVEYRSLTLTPHQSYWRTPQTPSKSSANKKKAQDKLAKASRKKNRKKR